MSSSFREEVTEIESMPKINTVEITTSDEDGEILKVTPDTITSEDRSQIESVLKSVVPNYVQSDDQQNTILVVHYEKESNTYKVFPTMEETTEENSGIDKIGEEQTRDSSEGNEDDEDNKEAD